MVRNIIELNLLASSQFCFLAYSSPAIEADTDAVRRMFDANVFGVMDMVNAFSELVIAAQGHIINMGSISGMQGVFMYGSGYAASKAALHIYSDVLRVEMQPFGYV